jgi:predicted RNase H-like HicB family nuclease
MTAERTFWVHYSRDDNDMWLAEVYRNPDVGERLGVATHGRTLVSTEANVREALALWFDVDDEQGFTLIPHYPDDIVRTAVEVSKKRDAARRAEHDAMATMAEAARSLVAQGLSLRDVGALLGISHQRVQQLLVPPTRASAVDQKTSSTPNPFESLQLPEDSLISALALLALLGFIAWDEHRKRKAARLVVKTPTRPLPAFATKPEIAQVYDFARAWAKRHGGSVDVPSAIAVAVEDRRRAI